MFHATGLKNNPADFHNGYQRGVVIIGLSVIYFVSLFLASGSGGS
jgi:hypothetical protein